MTFEEIKKIYVQGLLDTGAFVIKPINEQPFILRSGALSYMYLDLCRVASSPNAYNAFIDGIAYLLRNEYGKKDFILCNVDSKISAQMTGSLAYKLKKSQIIFKSKELTSAEKGTNKQLNGDLNWSLPVAILDDVMTGGDGTAKNVADLVKNTFKNVLDIQVFVGFIREPKPSTYETHYLVTRNELIDIVWDKLSERQKEAVDKERKGL